MLAEQTEEDNHKRYSSVLKTKLTGKINKIKLVS